VKTDDQERSNHQNLSLVFKETVPQRKICLQEQTHLRAHPQQTTPQNGALPQPALHNRHNQTKQQRYHHSDPRKIVSARRITPRQNNAKTGQKTRLLT